MLQAFSNKQKCQKFLKKIMSTFKEYQNLIHQFKTVSTSQSPNAI